MGHHYVGIYGDQWSVPDKQLPLVSYYRKDKDGFVENFKMIGNKVVQYFKMETTIIPIIRYVMYKNLRDDKWLYSGIVDNTKNFQIMINVGMSAIIERMNRSPKSALMVTPNMVNGLEDIVSRFADGDIPLVFYNDSTDDKPISGSPTPIVEQFQIADLVTMVQTYRNALYSAIGIQEAGIVEINKQNTTATEIMMQHQSSESNLADLYNAASAATEVTGKILVDLISTKKYKFKVENGPEIITQKMRKRQEVAMVSNLIPDSDIKAKSLIAKFYLESLDDESCKELSANLSANMDPSIVVVGADQNPDVLRVMQQGTQMAQSLQGQITELQNQLTEAQKQNEALNLSLLDNREARESDLAKTAMTTDSDTQIELEKIKLEYAKLGLQSNVDNKEIQLKLNEQKLKLYDKVQDQIKNNDEYIFGTPSQPVDSNIPLVED